MSSSQCMAHIPLKADFLKCVLLRALVQGLPQRSLLSNSGSCSSSPRETLASSSCFILPPAPQSSHSPVLLPASDISRHVPQDHHVTRRLFCLAFVAYHDASEFLLQQTHIPSPGIPCIPSSVDGHAGYSHFGIAMNTAAVDMSV